jgi:hypothetical protein
VAEELKVKAFYNERSLFSKSFSLGFLGLGRATAFTVLPLRLQFFEVFGTALRDLPPTLVQERRRRDPSLSPKLKNDTTGVLCTTLGEPPKLTDGCAKTSRLVLSTINSRIQTSHCRPFLRNPFQVTFQLLCSVFRERFHANKRLRTA